MFVQRVKLIDKTTHLDTDLHNVAMRALRYRTVPYAYKKIQTKPLYLVRYCRYVPYRSKCNKLQIEVQYNTNKRMSLVHYNLTKGPRVLRKGKEGSILAL